MSGTIQIHFQCSTRDYQLYFTFIYSHINLPCVQYTNNDNTFYENFENLENLIIHNASDPKFSKNFEKVWKFLLEIFPKNCLVNIDSACDPIYFVHFALSVTIY